MPTFLKQLLVLLFASTIAVDACLANRAPIQAAKTQISSFESALLMFEVDNGFYPSTEQGLDVLIEKPSTATNWTRPYLDGIPLDPWNNPYIYQYPAKHNTNRVDIYSFGEDGLSHSGGNDPDDINNWDSSFKISVEEFEAMFPPQFDKRVFIAVGFLGATMLLLFILWFRGR